MMDAVGTEFIPIVQLPSGKEYSAPSAFADVDTNDFATLDGAPWFDTEAFALGDFTDKYSGDGYLPGHISFEWKKTWCGRTSARAQTPTLFVIVVRVWSLYVVIFARK